jgi:hypothetical protein
LKLDENNYRKNNPNWTLNFVREGKIDIDNNENEDIQQYILDRTTDIREKTGS